MTLYKAPMTQCYTVRAGNNETTEKDIECELTTTMNFPMVLRTAATGIDSRYMLVAIMFWTVTIDV